MTDDFDLFLSFYMLPVHSENSLLHYYSDPLCGSSFVLMISRGLSEAVTAVDVFSECVGSLSVCMCAGLGWLRTD